MRNLAGNTRIVNKFAKIACVGLFPMVGGAVSDELLEFDRCEGCTDGNYIRYYSSSKVLVRVANCKGHQRRIGRLHTKRSTAMLILRPWFAVLMIPLAAFAADNPRHIDLGPRLTAVKTLEQNWS